MKLAIVVMTTVCIVVMLRHAQARCSDVPGYIYIMQEKTTGGNTGTLYKVGGVEGTSNKVDTRRRNLQTGNPRELVVKTRYKVTSCKKAEKDVHDDEDMNDHYAVYYGGGTEWYKSNSCLLYTSPSPRDATLSRMPSSA